MSEDVVVDSKGVIGRSEVMQNGLEADVNLTKNGQTSSKAFSSNIRKLLRV